MGCQYLRPGAPCVGPDCYNRVHLHGEKRKKLELRAFSFCFVLRRRRIFASGYNAYSSGITLAVVLLAIKVTETRKLAALKYKLSMLEEMQML